MFTNNLNRALSCCSSSTVEPHPGQDQCSQNSMCSASLNVALLWLETMVASIEGSLDAGIIQSRHEISTVVYQCTSPVGPVCSTYSRLDHTESPFKKHGKRCQGMHGHIMNHISSPSSLLRGSGSMEIQLITLNHFLHEQQLNYNLYCEKRYACPCSMY